LAESINSKLLLPAPLGLDLSLVTLTLLISSGAVNF
jgi:hypothetical protein